MSLEAKNLEKPDDRREFPSGSGALVHVGGHTVGRGVLEPGWRWSTHIKPLAETQYCEFTHTGVILAGTLHVEMKDGTTLDLNTDDVYIIPPGHDAWVIGDTAVNMLDWGPRIDDFAKGSSKPAR